MTRTGINLHITRSQSVVIEVTRNLEVQSMPGKYCLLAISASGNTLNLFCTDEQLDQIAAEIHTASKSPKREQIVQIIEDFDRMAKNDDSPSHEFYAGVGQVIAELKDLIGYSEEEYDAHLHRCSHES